MKDLLFELYEFLGNLTPGEGEQKSPDEIVRLRSDVNGRCYRIVPDPLSPSWYILQRYSVTGQPAGTHWPNVFKSQRLEELYKYIIVQHNAAGLPPIRFQGDLFNPEIL